MGGYGVTALDSERRPGKDLHPGYYNREGMADTKTRQGSFFFGTPTEYADLLEAWRAHGDMAGLEIRGGQASG